MDSSQSSSAGPPRRSLHVVTRIATAVAEAAGALPVVFVHGAMDRSTSFLKVRERLPELTTTLYDRRGYARSRHAEPAAAVFDDHVDDLVAVLRETRAVVVGHSFGADVALAASVRRPDLVASVLAFEPPMPWQPWWTGDSAGQATVKAVWAGREPADAAEVFMRFMIGDAAWEALPSRIRDERRAEGPTLLVDMRSLRSPQGAPPPFETMNVSVPVVLGCGSTSRAQHVETAVRLVDLFPRAERHTIDGGGHGAHITHPDAFAGLVRRAVALAQLSKK